MKLWLLTRIDTRPAWDVANGFVVRALTEDHARFLAAQQAGDEGQACWLAPTTSRCVELDGGGPPGIVLEDFNAG